MPSPFPGMDPFLEHPHFFPSLHASFIVYLREQLQGRLPAPYYADTGDRVWVESSERRIEPDVNVLRGEQPTPAAEDGNGGGGGTAVATAVAVAAEPVLVTAPSEDGHETYIDIYARRDDERLITTIELLSLSNKTPGLKGREAYLKKQREVLGGQVHLVEIDLLRGGTHSTAVPQVRTLKRTGPFHYHACVHHFDNADDFFVYPFTLSQRMPAIAVPLLPGDGSVVLDLQAVFDRAYDTGPYRRRVRYAEMTVEPPLNEAWTKWAGDVLRRKGVVPAEASQAAGGGAG